MIEYMDVLEAVNPYLLSSDRRETGTGDSPPAEPVPRLKRGVRLYDLLDGYIIERWGGHDAMPGNGKDIWYRLLKASRGGESSDRLAQHLLRFWEYIEKQAADKPVRTPDENDVARNNWIREQTGSTRQIEKRLREKIAAECSGWTPVKHGQIANIRKAETNSV